MMRTVLVNFLILSLVFFQHCLTGVVQEEIEEPMWADLSVCDSTNDETDDSWFNISHEFHQCSSRQLISIVLGPANLINIQEPTSPKLPASVTKSRGKNYKIKQWEQRKGKAIPNKQHPVKTFVLNLLLLTSEKSNF
ncbi:hypothetical protein HanLR1_Chr13g0475221 [Helianthus annuus]|nr:hypothetical protein HanHA89_Chr13g0505061 [Helianthus annuus]KAJ0662923.1 hypothetical protein HanLR1_Chr13g0475221 [Helianthus annuus]